MDAQLNTGRAETSTHVRLKRLALLWAQAQGYSACALEVSLPHCRYRADVAAYRPKPSGLGLTAIFECKQALPDLRRDNCCSVAVRARLETVYRPPPDSRKKFARALSQSPNRGLPFSRI